MLVGMRMCVNARMLVGMRMCVNARMRMKARMLVGIHCAWAPLRAFCRICRSLGPPARAFRVSCALIWLCRVCADMALLCLCWVNTTGLQGDPGMTRGPYTPAFSSSAFGTYTCMRTSTSKSVYAYIYIQVCVCIHLHPSLSDCMACACVCMCMCVCTRIPLKIWFMSASFLHGCKHSMLHALCRHHSCVGASTACCMLYVGIILAWVHSMSKRSNLALPTPLLPRKTRTHKRLAAVFKRHA